MKTYDERFQSVTAKMMEIKKSRTQKRLITGGCISLGVVILALLLFVPFSTEPPDVSMYAGSPYYSLIRQLNDVTYVPPEYANNFEKLLSSAEQLVMVNGGAMAPADPGELLYESAQSYVEVTDNQVSGVIESDLFKRSDQYLYYLVNSVLQVYTISGEDSRLVGQYNAAQCLLPEDSEDKSFGYTEAEMYLSSDCSTVTVLMDSYHESIGSCVLLVNLDVTDPANITTKSYVLVSGDMVSSRMVDGDILLTSNYRVYNADFSDTGSFVPGYGVPENMEYLPMENIICPDHAESARYTVVTMFDGDTLDVMDSTALLSYSQELYVSADTLYATHSYSQKSEESAGGYTTTAMTEITGIGYSGGRLQQLGSIALEGSIKDQYSLDQHQGILRVVTSTSSTVYYQVRDGEYVSLRVDGTARNVNLYCVDIADWAVVASVIGFAPEGESAESVRFDGETAYVCTAEVITLKDPVYFFDLSDLNHITWKDTGTIDGYSSSLIQMGDGFLLGIGFGDGLQLKVEVYEETNDGVEAVCSYERSASFSSEYKSYYIDREKGLIGLQVQDWATGEYRYVLLHFDGYSLNELYVLPQPAIRDMESTRATLIDQCLYLLFAPNTNREETDDCLRVCRIW